MRNWFHEDWTPRVIVLFILLNVFQLIVSLLNYDNVVWAADWESARQIANGIPMYEQQGTIFRGAARVDLPPDHFPVWFYFMAMVIVIFGPNQVIARIITWIFMILAFLLLVKLSKPKTENQLILIHLLFYLNPLLIIINYIGKFDQITLFILFLGLYFIMHERYLSGGLTLGIGVMTKFFPFFTGVAVGLFLLRKREIKNLIVFSFGSLLTSLSIYMYFYINYGSGFTKVVFFQINRLTPSLSPWYYLVSRDTSGTTLMMYQIAFLIFIAILLLLIPIDNDQNYIYGAAAVLAAAYLLGTRQYYSSYAYFFMMPLIPLFIELIKRDRGKLFVLGILNMPFYFAGTSLCDDTCYPQVYPMTYLSYFGIALVYLSTLFVIIYYGYLVYSKVFYPQGADKTIDMPS